MKEVNDLRNLSAELLKSELTVDEIREGLVTQNFHARLCCDLLETIARD